MDINTEEVRTSTALSVLDDPTWLLAWSQGSAFVWGSTAKSMKDRPRLSGGASRMHGGRLGGVIGSMNTALPQRTFPCVESGDGGQGKHSGCGSDIRIRVLAQIPLLLSCCGCRLEHHKLSSDIIVGTNGVDLGA
jgi:hypothetical protein